MEHKFNVDIATKYGLLEAILLENIRFWIEKNEANEKHFYDGHYWTYNSIKAFNELFPYATEKQIRNALEKLKLEGLIMTGNYNKSSYDRTLWYALTEKGKCIFPGGQMEIAKKANGFSPEGKPIPDNNTDNKPKEKKEKRKTEIDDFLEKQIEDIELRNIFCEFIKMRKSIKKPMTTYALQRMLAKLNRFTKNIEEQKAILNKSIINCWQDIYSLNEKEKKDINDLKTNCKIETTEKNLLQYTIEYTDKLTETEYGELVREYGSEKYKELLSKYEKEGKVIKKKIEW